MTAIATLDAAIKRAEASAVSTGNAARHSLRSGAAREAQYRTAAEAEARAEALRQVRAEVVELIDAAQWALKQDDAGAMSDTARHNLEQALARIGGAA